MSKKVGILILHGIGQQETGYSMKLQQNLINDFSGSELKEVLYSDLFPPDLKLLDSSHSWQLATRTIRRLFITFLSDATSYKDRDGYKLAQLRLSDEIAKLKQNLDEDSPIIVVAHSMGAMLISDYVYDEQKPPVEQKDWNKTKIVQNLRAIVTFGCNIPLFETGHKKTVSIQRPSEKFEWLNFFSPFDPLGYKMETYYQEELNEVHKPSFIKDKEIYPGGLFTSWNFFSHASYWTSTEISSAIRRIIKSER